MQRRAAVVFAALAAPFFVFFVADRRVVRPWGDAIARRLTSAVRAVQWVFPPPPRVAPRISAAPQPATPASATAGGLGGWRAPMPDTVAGEPPTVLRVPASVVQRAIDEIGVHPRGKTVVGDDGRPAGVKLSGVVPLGIGLRDGDVLVAVEGAPALDDGTATDLALAPIARGASVLHVLVRRYAAADERGDAGQAAEAGEPSDAGSAGDELLLLAIDLPASVPASGVRREPGQGPGKAR